MPAACPAAPRSSSGSWPPEEGRPSQARLAHDGRLLPARRDMSDMPTPRFTAQARRLDARGPELTSVWHHQRHGDGEWQRDQYTAQPLARGGFWHAGFGGGRGQPSLADAGRASLDRAQARRPARPGRRCTEEGYESCDRAPCGCRARRVARARPGRPEARLAHDERLLSARRDMSDTPTPSFTAQARRLDAQGPELTSVLRRQRHGDGEPPQ